MNSPDWGEAGGIFAGLVGALVALGHGLKWLLGWEQRRDSTRSAKLDAWQRELAEREDRIEAQERAYRADIEKRLSAVTALATTMHAQLEALRNSYRLVAGALRSISPENHALSMADELLKSAFPPDAASPAEMLALLGAIDAADSKKGD